MHAHAPVQVEQFVELAKDMSVMGQDYTKPAYLLRAKAYLAAAEVSLGPASFRDLHHAAALLVVLRQVQIPRPRLIQGSGLWGLDVESLQAA